jgi:hypothetical protein
MSGSPKYEIIEIDHIEITVDVSLLIKSDDMFFNATEIASRFSKKPNEWLDSKQASEYIRVILEAENLRYENLVITSRGGKYQGTWLQKKLALPFARWLSVRFEYALDKWISERLTEEHQRRQYRLEAKTGFLPLTNAIQSAHAEVNSYHFLNECDLINRIVTGMSAKKFKAARGVKNVRDALSAAQLQLLEKLQRQNTTLIELGFDYEERKRFLTSQAESARCF